MVEGQRSQAAVESELEKIRTLISEGKYLLIWPEFIKLPGDYKSILPFEEAAKLVPNILQVQKMTHQDYGFILKRDGEKYHGWASRMDYVNYISGKDGQKVFFDNVLEVSNVRQASNFSFHGWTLSKLESSVVGLPWGKSRENILFAKVADQNKVAMAVYLGERGSNRQALNVLTFEMDSKDTVDRLEEFVAEYGPNGLNALFGILLSDEVTPELEITKMEPQIFKNIRRDLFVALDVNTESSRGKTKLISKEVKIEKPKPMQDTEWVSIDLNSPKKK